jgi:hypothetical protein
VATAALASNVIDLTPANFDDIVGSGKPALVEFFAPWYVSRPHRKSVQHASLYFYANSNISCVGMGVLLLGLIL